MQGIGEHAHMQDLPVFMIRHVSLFFNDLLYLMQNLLSNKPQNKQDLVYL